jgi:hypothetical protein
VQGRDTLGRVSGLFSPRSDWLMPMVKLVVVLLLIVVALVLWAVM